MVKKLIVLITLFQISTLFAQENALSKTNNTNSIDNENSYYIEKLKLTEEQAIQFETINTAYITNVNALKSESKNRDYKDKLNELENNRDKQMKEILSKKQFKQYVELRQNKRKQLQGLIRKQN